MRWPWLAVALSLGGLASGAFAHEIRPGYLELEQTGAETFEVLWRVPAHGDLALEVAPVLPDSCAVTASGQRVAVSGAVIERSTVRCADGLAGRAIAVRGPDAGMLDVLVRVRGPKGIWQTARLTPTAPAFVVAAAPTWTDIATTYLRLGVEHILLGIDHLLFVLALVLLVRSWRRLIGVITAFTVAHSLTLAAATFGLVQVPPRPVEAAIALSIVFVAAEIVHAREGRFGLGARSPWLVAFLFGLLHGLGFAGALRALGLPENTIPTALLFFNLGVEFGQLAFVAVVLAALALLRRLPLSAPPWGWRLLPYAIGTVATFWTLERVASFWT
jgi:hydrogenase/urease accessory protein HupE